MYEPCPKPGLVGGRYGRGFDMDRESAGRSYAAAAASYAYRARCWMGVGMYEVPTLEGEVEGEREFDRDPEAEAVG